MEYKSLFLQGNCGIGKSTLILESIKQFLPVTAGFLSQRLISGGETMGFCLTPINLASSAIEEFYEEKPNIFLHKRLGKWQRNDEVFFSHGVKLLSELKGKQLIVLDEIGGMELLIEPFRNKLYEVLACGIPCIGVIKSYNNKSLMEKSIDLGQSYTEQYLKLCDDIVNIFGGVIISAEHNNMGEIKNTVETFLNTIMKVDKGEGYEV